LKFKLKLLVITVLLSSNLASHLVSSHLHADDIFWSWQYVWSCTS